MSLFLMFLLLSGKVQENKLNTKAPTLEVRFEEELRVDANEDEAHFLWADKNTSVSVDDQGFMYVADIVENRILVIDPKGKYVRTMGGKGEGPGEFLWLSSFHVLDDGSAMAIETIHFEGWITTYDKSMKFLSKHPIKAKSAFSGLKPSGDGRFFMGERSHTEIIDGRMIEVNEHALFNPQLESLAAIHINRMDSFPAPPEMTRQDWLDALAPRYALRAKGLKGFTTVDQKGRFYSALGNSYEITVRDSKMKTLNTFTHTYTPKLRTASEIIDFLDRAKASLKSVMAPQFHSIFTDSFMKEVGEMAGLHLPTPVIGGLLSLDNHLLVVRPPVGGEKSLVDIFDETGTFRGSFHFNTHGLEHMVFKGGKAYTIESVDEELELVRYKVLLQATK